MSQLDSNRLAQLATDALERTAFVLVEHIEPEQAAELSAPDRFSRITYSGPSDGTFILGATDGFLRELAFSILGVEPDEIDLDAQGIDALKELTNIIGGSGLLDLGGDKRLHSLGLPELMDSSAPENVEAEHQCWLESEGELLRVMWVPGKPVASAAA